MDTSRTLLDLMGGRARTSSPPWRPPSPITWASPFSSTPWAGLPAFLDFDAVSALVQLAPAPPRSRTPSASLAGNENLTEGFKEGQSCSSRIPHKMNARSCERVGGLQVILRVYLTMVADTVQASSGTRAMCSAPSSAACAAGRVLRH